MIIPKEIREKIKQRLKLDQEIESYLKQNTHAEGIDIRLIKVTNVPLGSANGEGVYCNKQHTLGSDFGHYYFPMDDDHYLCVFFDTDDWYRRRAG